MTYFVEIMPVKSSQRIESFREDSLLFSVIFQYLHKLADEDSKMAIESRIQEIMKDMTIEQKVGQMVQGEIKWIKPGDVSRYHLGSILNGGGSHPNRNKNADVQDWLNLADEVYLESIDKSRGGAGIPIIWGTDAVHGHNNVIGATLFPHNIGLGAANDPSLLRRIGEITASRSCCHGY